jgi:hypothetical protein
MAGSGDAGGVLFVISLVLFAVAVWGILWGGLGWAAFGLFIVALILFAVGGVMMDTAKKHKKWSK